MKLGLLANQATVDSNYNHILDILVNQCGTNVVRVFAPEHGFRGTLQDMDSVDDLKDEKTGLPIHSLYGDSEDTLAPSADLLEDLDALIVDLPDIGSRYYTFAQTLGYCMKIAASVDTKVFVLDRPNPLNGVTIEGAPLKRRCRSFCGYAPIANRHGMTLGELALLMNAGFGEGEDRLEAANCDLEVVELKGWNRSQYFEETKLPWVLPSPNMPSMETVVIYPGSCLFEATEVSEGRGTTKPLETFGAPYINPDDWIAAVREMDLDLKGAVLRPSSFVPKFQKHAGKTCWGIQLHVLDREEFQSVRWSLALIAALHATYPSDFAWRKAAFEFVDRVPAIDLLYGSANYRETLEKGMPLDSIFEEMRQFETEFSEARKPFLLY
jgi:uncharacterized protein YbbC (DUF1343 family)